MEDVVARIRELMDNEARSCITPEYVHRMWGGTVTIEEIRPALRACLKEFYGR